jgi:hypothetical protein
MNYTPTTHQFICVLSKKIPAGRALNALGIELAEDHAI